MKKCTECGFVNRDDAVKCAECSADLPVSDSGYVFCSSCGKKVTRGLKFCTSCGAKLEYANSESKPAASQPSQAAHKPDPAPAKTAGFGKDKLFALLGGVVSLLTVMFALIFVFTPFIKVKVSFMGESETEKVSAISIFAGLLKGNSSLSDMDVGSAIGYASSIAYWVFAFVFVAYLVYAVSNIGAANYHTFKSGIKYLSVMTVVSLVIMILGNVAMSDATEGIKEYEQLGFDVSKYVSGTGLFVTMLLMLIGYIVLFALYKHGEAKYPFARAMKAKKPLKIILMLALCALLAVTVITGIIGMVGKKGSSGKKLVNDYFEAIEDRDIEKIAECMYPEGSAEYSMIISMGMSALPISGSIDDWDYETIEKNDYVERGNLSLTINGRTEEDVFWLQKSSRDGKWHVTADYAPAYYDGSIGTDYSNAAPATGSVTESHYRYFIYECDSDGTYAIASDYSFEVKDFKTSSVGSSSNGYGNNELNYGSSVRLVKGKAYYIVFNNTSQKILSITASGSPNAPSNSSVSGTLYAGDYEYLEIDNEEKYYKLNLTNENYLITAGGDGSDYTNENILFGLYDSNFNSLGSSDKRVLYLKETGSYIIGIKTSGANYFTNRAIYVRAMAEMSELEAGKTVSNYYNDNSVFPFTAKANAQYSIMTTARFNLIDEDNNTILPQSGKYEVTANKKYYILPYYMSGYTSFTVGDKLEGVSAEMAQRVIPGTSVKGEISSSGEIRWYKFTATSSYDCTVSTTGYNDTYGVLYVCNNSNPTYSSLSKLASNDDGGNNENFIISYSVSYGNTYYIAVRLDGDSTGSFVLNVSRNENGASYDTAYTVASSSTTVSYNGGNVTYYRFIAAGDYTYNVYTQGSVSVRVTVQDADGNTIASKTTASPTNADLYVQCEEGQEYYVLVQFINGSASSATTLRVTY